MAGVGPTVTESKSVALPLGYIPATKVLYNRAEKMSIFFYANEDCGVFILDKHRYSTIIYL